MSEFAARIGRVRMKSGGADVRVLAQRAVPFEEEEDYRGALLRNAKTVIDAATDEAPLVGYLLIGMYDDGCTSTGFRYAHDNGNAIPRTLLPAWTAEVIRRELITSVTAEDQFKTMFKWQDGA
jgi:hypothetical protein